MLVKYCLLLFCAYPCLPLHAQNKQPNDTKVITISNKGIKDCIYQDGRIFLLDLASSVWRVDEKSWAFQKVFTGRNKVVAMAADSAENLILADSTGLIFSAGKKDINRIHKIKDNILYLVNITRQSIYAITEHGIYSVDDERNYYENAFSSPMIGMFNRKGWHPSCMYLDPDHNIWLGFDMGEWGGDLLMFSTVRDRYTAWKEIQKGYCYTRPVRSIFRADSSMYASSSLYHMRVRSFIRKLNDSCASIFESQDWGDSTDVLYKDEPLYIGPALYNEKDSSFYFYSQHGVFKSIDKKNTRRMDDWQLVVEPNLLWRYAQPKAAGYRMNVTKMFFAGEKLFLVSPENGLFIWDGKNKFLLN